MKYMGSKRWMLANGLGDLISKQVRQASRFVDLFAGSGAVSSHVASNHKIPVIAYDLQTFSAVLTQAVIGRESKVNAHDLWASWYRRASAIRKLVRPISSPTVTRATVAECRDWCSRQFTLVTRAYGGYYFSALQAVWFDALLQALPTREPERTVALAAVICTASRCAASPGHTAQPFQPTRTAKPFLAEAWALNVITHCRETLFEVSGQHAVIRGNAKVCDANEAAGSTRKGDLVFVDPPYSSVHYSRFYHVLETIARGHCSEVSGTGRYPVARERPRSKYCLKSGSSKALDELFHTIASRGARAVVTFPLRRCSNGLSGSAVAALANRHFSIESHWVASKFSTLGGNNDVRNARRSTREMILVLNPR